MKPTESISVPAVRRYWGCASQLWPETEFEILKDIYSLSLLAWNSELDKNNHEQSEKMRHFC